MSHLVFLSESEAALAEAQIVANVRAWADANAPEAVSENGYLRGRNAATGQLTESVTMRWDNPTALNDGRFAILKPTAERVAPMPLAMALAGVTAVTEITQAEYEAALQLDAAGKSSPKLAAVQAWMDGMIAAGVTNPNEARSDWPVAPYSFQEASGEALAALSSPNPET